MRLYSVKNFTELENKTEITLGKTLASGGAGQIKLCEQDTGLVAKVYHENVDISLYEQKLEAMLKNPPLLQPLKVDEKIFPQLSWPSALIIDKNNSFVGYLMPRMSLNSSVSLERFLQKRMRRHEKLPEYYGHRINIAYNLSTIVESLHMKGHYIIDLKPQNCFIHRSKMYVTVLDSDGFSILDAQKKRYPAFQFTEEYIAPEFISKSPSSLGKNQDNFALAVIIFKLLNNGIHPFQAVMKRKQKTIHEMVRERKYSYGRNGPKNLIPNYQSIHQFFPNDLRDLFDRAFIEKDRRPNASDWKLLLRKFAESDNSQMQRCEKNPSEHIDFGLGCGFCAMEHQKGELNFSNKQISKNINKKIKLSKSIKNIRKSHLASRGSINAIEGYLLANILKKISNNKPFKTWHGILIPIILCLIILLEEYLVV